jgi:tyrosine aminotransferase
MATNSIGEQVKKTKWRIIVSSKVKETVNPIRTVVETLKLEPNPDKQLIPLSIGKLKF